MGHLKNGQWHSGNVVTSNDQGEFDREKSEFRETITADHKKYQPEENRYHLYVSYACPWAHRTLITRKLKKLDSIISVDVVHPHMLEHSWSFNTDFPKSTGDSLYHKEYLYQIYQKHDSKVTTKVTVPVLWDKKTQSIVNNESSEIIRIFNKSFEGLAPETPDLYPEKWQSEINEWNEKIYEPVNNGVYKCGFASNQEAYDKAYKNLFKVLNEIENHLEDHEYLVGDQLTEADIRLLTTLLRFDAVYYIHFKCNERKISEFPNLYRYTLALYEREEIKATTHIDHIKEHYYYSHEFINPKRIVPQGPVELFK
ncbi:MAG: glutathione-dependent reductase [Halobacteriovoraceae bacterium]|nr:glutathione-dependent reductase [Halobacteriovoraceae bacterium]|tara:strand:+ start:28995 stop:29930 length:936 start_codon:yes stop_codon:yes gene_type:complete